MYLAFTKSLAQEYAESQSHTQIGTKPEELSKADIRAMLHPGYPTHKMPQNRVIRTASETRLKNSRPSIKVHYQQTPYSRYKKDFSLNTIDTFSRTKTTNYPNLGFTVTNDGAPYIDPDSKMRQTDQESKRKWVSNRNFVSVFSTKKQLKESTEGLLLCKSAAAANHVFRAEDKEKWIGGSFKVAKY